MPGAEGEVSVGFAVLDPMNPLGEGEKYTLMSKEEATKQVEELNKDRKETTSPETEVEQSARRKAIDNYFENILGQIEITVLEPSLREMDGEIERTIGEKKCN